MNNKHENKMETVEEISGPVSDFGRYSLDYKQGQVVALLDLAKTTDYANFTSKTEVQIPIEGILKALVQSTETKFDDAALQWVLDRL